MSGQSTPVNSSDVVVLDMKNLSGSVQFRVTVDGDLQWKLLNGSTWFKICNIELLRGRSITDVTVNAQNKFVLTFSDLTTQVITISALEDAVLRATNAAIQALASAGAASTVAMGQATARPLSYANTMNFAQAKALPTSIQFSRSTVATYADSRGIIRTAKANVARFNHNPETGESLGILIEESRTNYATNSNSFLIDTNTKFNIVGTTSAPDASTEATIFEKKDNLNWNFIHIVDTSVLPNGIYTRSLFVKKMSADECILVFEGVGGTAGSGGALSFNLETKVFSGSTAEPIEYGYDKYPDGWLRVWVSVEKSATKIIASNFYLGGYSGSSASQNRIAIWGGQFENGKYASSYIKTTGTSFTRGNDIPLYKNRIYRNFAVSANGIKTKGWEKNQNGYGIVLGTTVSSVLLGYGPNLNSTNIFDGANLNTPSIAVNGLKDTLFSTAMSFSLDDSIQKITLNGGAISSSATSNSSFTTNDWYIGCRNGSTNYLNGTIKAITIYSRNLTDVELQEVTSIRLSGTSPKSIPSNNDLGSAAFLDIASLLSYKNRQEFSMDCTGASITRNIRRPYPFLFEIVDSSGVTVTSQPASSCVENTDNNLVITGAVGKTLTYAITPIFEY